MSIIRDYLSVTPCKFFEAPPVKRCLIRFIQKYGGGSTFAPIDSPNFTGTPTAPTAAPGTDTTQIATTAFVDAAISSIPASPSAANPTSSVGITAVNGVATTFMRSDAAPAISQDIIPIWTGIHTFGSNPIIKNVLPNIEFKDAADNSLGFINFGDGVANVPAFISTITSDQLRFTVGISPDATLTLGDSGQIGLGNPVAFGVAGQLLTSGGPTAPPTWTTPATAPINGDSPGLTFDPVPANDALDLGFTLTGAVIGDVVALGIPAAAQVNGVQFTAMVSNTDVITIRCHNYTGSPISIPIGVFKATVFK